jgi:phosphoglycerate dehydrogenase-like enzyme
MILINSSLEISLLFIGPNDFFEEVRSSVPKSWKVTCMNSIEEFMSSPLDVNVILDSSIREIIDLNLIKFDKVKVIACASTGTNHIKLQIKNSDGITIYSLKDTPDLLKSLTSAAEFSFGLLIALAKQLIPAAKSVESGVWNRTEFPGAILNKKQLGLIGLGRIGSAMALFAKSFGMSVGYYDPNLKSRPYGIFEYDSIESLVANSDFISVHIPYFAEADVSPIITKNIFSLFKHGSYFINTSRGELIDEAGLITEIDSGRIRGAALDVIVDEPDISSNSVYNYAKKTKANIIFTPHIAGYSIENVKIATMGMLNYLIDQLNRK